MQKESTFDKKIASDFEKDVKDEVEVVTERLKLIETIHP